MLTDGPGDRWVGGCGHWASGPELSGRGAEFVGEDREVEDEYLAGPRREERPGHVEAAEAWHPVVEDHHVWHRRPIEVPPHADGLVAVGRLADDGQAVVGHLDDDANEHPHVELVVNDQHGRHRSTSWGSRPYAAWLGRHRRDRGCGPGGVHGEGDRKG